MSANLIFGTIKAILAGGTTGTALVTLQNGETVTVPNANAGLLFTDIISWFIGMGGVIAAIFVVFGGISYITANGDAGKIVKAKNMILYALIGLVIVGLAELITSAVAGMIRDANTKVESTSYSNTITLAKEANEK
jgi:cytochrome bd-type quinol oxidase subunit 2